MTSLPSLRPRAPVPRILLLAALACGAAAAQSQAPEARPAGTAGALATVAVQGESRVRESSFEGVVQAVRQATLAAQVAGNVVEVRVRAGQWVRAGEVLLRLDALAAEQGAAASEAQVREARAALGVATRDFERQRQLFEKKYISEGAFDRSQALFQAAQAQSEARLAQAAAARAQSGWFTVTAPFAGIVSDVPVVAGDLATPGRTLVTLYDPSSLRVSSLVPQSALRGALLPAQAAIELGEGAAGARITPVRVQVFPAADPATHTVEVRLDLPASVRGVVPGTFARALLAAPQVPQVPQGASLDGSNGARLLVPLRSVVRRAEMTGIYVVGTDGRAQLRQVRLGEPSGEMIEVLSGLDARERVALDPQAALRAR
jgi:multidrug efflux system membrane fusion protein